jgi:hypothetical protein
MTINNGDGPSDISRSLLLPHTVAKGSMTSNDHFYRGARGTRAISTSSNSSDGSFDISGPLLLPSIVASGYMTTDDRCYCWARGMHEVATSNEHSNISGPSLLASTVVME